jgi:hypothetical protein
VTLSAYLPTSHNGRNATCSVEPIVTSSIYPIVKETGGHHSAIGILRTIFKEKVVPRVLEGILAAQEDVRNKVVAENITNVQQGMYCFRVVDASFHPKPNSESADGTGPFQASTSNPCMTPAQPHDLIDGHVDGNVAT